MKIEKEFEESWARLEKTALLIKKRYKRLASLFFDVMAKHVQECECELCKKADREIQRALKLNWGRHEQIPQK